jgi:hypothetical protein
MNYFRRPIDIQPAACCHPCPWFRGSLTLRSQCIPCRKEPGALPALPGQSLGSTANASE